MAGDLKKDERGDDAALMHMATEFKDPALPVADSNYLS